MKISLVGTLVFWGIAMCSTGAVGCQPQEPGLFSRVDLSATKLTPKQEKILDRLSRQKTSAAVEVVMLKKDGMSNLPPTVTIPLPGDESITLIDFNLEAAGDKTASEATRLKGHAEDAEDTALLSLTGSSVSGMVYWNKNVYSVEPLGGGLQAIVRLDPTRFPPDEPPAAQYRLERPRR